MKKVKESIYVDYMPKGIPKDQRWFWTKRWQKMEREADEDIMNGRVYHCDSVEEFIKAMHGEKKLKYMKKKQLKQFLKSWTPAFAKTAAGKQRCVSTGFERRIQ